MTEASVIAESAVPTYKLDLFEGPLDLLLSLVARNKIDINDIPIAVLCDQYMEYIGAAESADMELSADFLVMASTLMLIKSRMLLPRMNEDEEDPRAMLAAAMLEYKRAKEAAAMLGESYAEYGSRFAKETDEIPPDKGYIAPADVSALAKALLRVMSEVRVTDSDSRERMAPILNVKTVSVTGKIYALMVRMRRSGPTSLLSYFGEATSRAELIAMFMGVLELLRAQRAALICASDDEGVIELTPELKIELITDDRRVEIEEEEL